MKALASGSHLERLRGEINSLLHRSDPPLTTDLAAKLIGFKSKRNTCIHCSISLGSSEVAN